MPLEPTIEPAPTADPRLAAILSLLLPGAGQWYAGQRATAVVLLITVGGIAFIVLTSHSMLTTLFMGVLYVFIAISAAGDAARVAQGQASTLTTGSRWRVIFLLVSIGPFALPMLWQNQRFSRGAKIGLTIAVLLIAVGSVLLLGALGPAVERMMQDATSF